jgi:hypothetical protein
LGKITSCWEEGDEDSSLLRRYLESQVNNYRSYEKRYCLHRYIWYDIYVICDMIYDIYVICYMQYVMLYDIWYMWCYMIYDMIWYDVIYDIFNCNWVATRWQLFSTHIHTNNTENDTKQTIHRTQKIHRTKQRLGRVQAVPRLCGFYPGICLTTKEKARKNLS